MIDLHDLSLKELKDLQGQVAKAIASYEDRRKLDTLAKMRELARAEGFQFEEIVTMVAPRKRAPSTTIYVNPADPNERWSGRGRKPRWFIEALAAGTRREELLA